MSMTTNLKLAASPGNVLVRASEAPVPEDSVAVVTQNMAIDRSLLLTRYGEMPYALMEIIDEGVRVVLDIF